MLLNRERQLVVCSRGVGRKCACEFLRQIVAHQFQRQRHPEQQRFGIGCNSECYPQKAQIWDSCEEGSSAGRWFNKHPFQRSLSPFTHSKSAQFDCLNNFYENFVSCLEHVDVDSKYFYFLKKVFKIFIKYYNIWTVTDHQIKSKKC